MLAGRGQIGTFSLDLFRSYPSFADGKMMDRGLGQTLFLACPGYNRTRHGGSTRGLLELDQCHLKCCCGCTCRVVSLYDMLLKRYSNLSMYCKVHE